MREIRQLKRLLCDKLETVVLGFGVEAITLATPVSPPVYCRSGMFEAMTFAPESSIPAV